MKRLILLRRNPLLLMALATLAFSACTDKSEKHRTPGSQKELVGSSHSFFKKEEAIQTLSVWMQRPLAADSSKGGRNSKVITTGIRSSYKLAGYRPFWVDEDGLSSFSKSLLTDLDSLKSEGISPGHFQLGLLQKQFDKLSKAGGTAEEALAFDTACTRAYLQASHDLLMGLILPKQGDSLWYHSNDSLWDAPKLLAGAAKDEKYVPLSTYRSNIPTYNLLRQEWGRYTMLAADKSFSALKASVSGKTIADSLAVQIIRQETPWIQPVSGDSMGSTAQYIRGFQEYAGLAPTGKMDSITVRRLARLPDSVLPVIAANLERIRWMPQHLETQYVVVDIPLMELFYRKDGQDRFNMRVVVGKPARQTPVLNANMANVVFSPGWGVPPTILKNDVLPGISKRGGNYLARKGLRAYDRHGRQVNAHAVTAKNYRNYSFRQPPGARNALGEVKFNLPNKWDIYLHDTPHRGDFVKRYRAKSSGCVRVEKPKEFAQFILQGLEGRNFDAPTIDSIIETRKTRFENLKTKIPVHIIYLTAFEDNSVGRIRFLQDIYSRDKRLIHALGRVL